MSEREPSWMPSESEFYKATGITLGNRDERKVMALIRRAGIKAQIEALEKSAKYSRDCASLTVDDDVSAAHERTALRMETTVAALRAELAESGKEGT